MYDFRWTDVSGEFRDEDLGEIQEELCDFSASIGVFESADGDTVLRSEKPIDTQKLEALFQKMKEPLQEKLYVDKIRKIGERGSPYPQDHKAFRYLLGKLKDVFWNPEENLENQKHRLHIFETIAGLVLHGKPEKREIAEELGYLNPETEEEYADFFLKVINMSVDESSGEARETKEMKRRSFQMLSALSHDGEERIAQLLNQFVNLSDEDAQKYKVLVLRGLMSLSSEVREDKMRERLKDAYNSAETEEKRRYLKKWLNENRIFG